MMKGMIWASFYRIKRGMFLATLLVLLTFETGMVFLTTSQQADPSSPDFWIQSVILSILVMILFVDKPVLEENKWFLYSMTLPISKKKYILSKFLNGFLICLADSLLFTLPPLLFQLRLNSFDLTSLVLGFSIVFGIVFLLYALIAFLEYSFPIIVYIILCTVLFLGLNLSLYLLDTKNLLAKAYRLFQNSDLRLLTCGILSGTMLLSVCLMAVTMLLFPRRQPVQ